MDVPTVFLDLFQKERKQLEEERKLHIEERRQYNDERTKLEERAKEERTKLEERAKEERTKLEERLKEELARLEALYKQMIDEKERIILPLQIEVLARQSELRAIATMRPLLELYCCQFIGTTNRSAAVQNFINAVLLQNQNQRQWVENQVQALEGNTLLLADVKRELADLYHELSKQIHHPELKRLTGFVCGGAAPVRIATALVLLKLQQVNALPYDITYADEHYQKKSRLVAGNVVPI